MDKAIWSFAGIVGLAGCIKISHTAQSDIVLKRSMATTTPSAADAANVAARTPFIFKTFRGEEGDGPHDFIEESTGTITTVPGSRPLVTVSWINTPALVALFKRPNDMAATEAFKSAVETLWSHHVTVLVTEDAARDLPASVSAHKSLVKVLPSADWHKLPVDFSCVFGGDGSLLYAARAFPQGCPPVVAFALISGLLAFAGSLSYAELGAAIPASGGEVVYLERAFGSLTSFLFTWTNAVVTRPAALGIICLVSGENACRVWFSSESQCHSTSSLTKTLALICVGLVAVINAVSVRAATTWLNILTSFKLFALFIVGSAGLIVALKGNPEPTLGSHSFDNTSARLLDYPLAFLAALWAFDGWNNLKCVVFYCLLSNDHFLTRNPAMQQRKWSIPTILPRFFNGAFL